ncbi:MAG: hypothetical protein MJZ11_08375 [Lachnospiraceae bacterium]|nr:hypothetical protein [Lachnospiraceae bacterium]
MKHVTFTCDRCGKEIYGNEDDIPHLSLINARYSVQTDKGLSMRTVSGEYDLCSDCVKEIVVDLNKYKENNKDRKLLRKINEIIEENK